MTDFENRVQIVVATLARAVAEALERKRRLGQYAIIERAGKAYQLLPLEMVEGSKEH